MAGHRRLDGRARGEHESVVPAQTLYLDTSVIGGFHDTEFLRDTRALWRLMERGAYRFCTSRVAMNELRGAPLVVRQLAARTFADAASVLDVSPEAFALAAGLPGGGGRTRQVCRRCGACGGGDVCGHWHHRELELQAPREPASQRALQCRKRVARAAGHSHCDAERVTQSR